MKKTLPIYIICLLAIPLFTTCKKSTTTTTAPATGISFKVDGVLTTMALAGATMTNSGQTITMSGNTNNGPYPALILTLRNPVVGTNTPVSLAYLVAANEEYIFTSGSESVIITSLTSSSVTGTFQFTGTTQFVTPVLTKTITEGAFKCPVTQQ